MMIRHILPSLLLLVVAMPAWAQQPDSPRTKYNFNAAWLVKVGDAGGAEATTFADTDWKKVTLPYAWNEDSAFKVSIDELPTGIAWYRKHFTLPADAAGKKVFLEFEGIRHGGEFYLNGESIGRSDNGVMAFGFDVTDKLKPAPQENVLAARIDNAWNYKEKDTGSVFQWNDKNFYANYGGINKNVSLHITDKLHQTLPLYSNLGTTGVYVYAQDLDVAGKSAKVTAEAQVRNEYAEPKTFAYEVNVTDLDGKPVQTIQGGEQTIAPGETKTVSASARISNLNFWSWGYGYLYNVSTTLKVDGKPVDVVRTRTGFRKTEFGNGMVKLNDRVIHLKGYAQRTTNEWPALGIDLPPWLSDFSNGLMVQSNANFVRWMHVTPSKQDVESCDRVGLMQAMPAGDSERDPGAGRRWDQRMEVMRDAIIYNRNNPSILMYEGGNANIADERMAQLVKLRDELDPHGGRAMGCRIMLGSEVAEWGGDMLYVNKSAKKPLWATEYSRDEGLRKYWDELSPPFHKDGDGPLHKNESAKSYNRNQDSHALEDVRRWFDYYEQRPGTGTRVNAGGVNIVFADSNTHHRGAENYRRSGEVDAVRIPKDGFFAHQVMWDGWVDVENPRAHIVGHWNYKSDTRKDVYVVSGADKVELLLNGNSLGFGQQSSRFLYTFKDVKWEPGTLQAVGSDANGKKVCTAEQKTAGNPAAVRLTPRTNPAGTRADGSDVALFDVEVVDADGNRCPTALNEIRFDLSGPAEWRGGIAQAPDNGILSKTLPVECGVNRVIVRAATTPGTIELKASADGLKPATATVQTKPIAVDGGLARALPADDLAPSLTRGPTPPAEPLRVVRQTVRPDRVKVGSGEADVAKLTDDDETTAWTSEDGMSNAWVQFEFDKPTEVSEVVARFGSWRTTGYPLRVFADDREVFGGVAPSTVGYSTLRFPSTACRTLRVQLAGKPSGGGNAELIEVTGKADERGGDDAKSRSKLVVHEIELFRAMPSAGPAAVR